MHLTSNQTSRRNAVQTIVFLHDNSSFESFSSIPVPSYLITTRSCPKSKMSSRVRLPRLRREGAEDRRVRTPRACDLCRQRKTKCDGKEPTCPQCQDDSWPHASIQKVRLRWSEKRWPRPQKNSNYTRIYSAISPPGGIQACRTNK